MALNGRLPGWHSSPNRVAEGRVSSSRDDNATSSTPPPLDDNRFTSSSTPVLTPGSRSRACYMEYNPVPAHHHHQQQRQCQQPQQHPAAPPYAAMHSICNAAAAAAAAANQIQQPQEFLFGSTTAASHSYQIPTHHPFFAPANPDYYPTNGVVVGSGSSNGLQQMQEISSSSRPATSISSNHCSTNLMPLMSLQTAAGNTINQGGQYTLSSHLNRCNMLPTTGQFSSNHPNAHPNNPAANQMSSPNNNTNYQQQQIHQQQQQQQQFAAAYHNSFTPHFMAAAMDYSGSLRYAPNDMGMAAIPNAHHSQHQPNNPHHPFNYPPHHPHNLTPSNNNQLLPPAPMPPPANFHAFYRPDQKIRETFLALTKIKQRNIPANPTQINNRLITNRAFRLPEKPETEFCKVCGAKSSGFHFGVFTCEACKGFFRRYSRKQRVITPCAVRCEITISNRNNCPACRFAKCKAVGMAIENIRYGKPPKCVKLPRSISSVIPRLEDPDVLNRLLDAYSSSQPINTPSKTLSFARCTASILKIPNFVDPPKMPSTAPNQPAQAVMPTNIHQILLAVLNDELPEPHRITDVFEKILMCLFAQYKESISTNDNCIGDKILQMSEQIFATDRKRKAKFMLTLVYVTSVYI